MLTWDKHKNAGQWGLILVFLLIYMLRWDFDILRFSKSVHTLQELGFDYLRDNLSRNKEQLVMRWYILDGFLTLLKIVPPALFLYFKYYWFDRPRPFHFAIVDEVDSVLIDEGRNPLLISGEVWSLITSWTWFLQCYFEFYGLWNVMYSTAFSIFLLG